MAAGTFLVTQGTQTGIPIDTVSGTTYPISKIDVGNIGSSVPWQGTVRVSVGTMAAGTVNTGTINAGTINSATVSGGTINLGTVESVYLQPNGAWTSTINSGTNTLGTLKAIISGSSIYITDLIISVGSASNVAIFGGATTNVIAGTYNLGNNGGLVSNFRVPINGQNGSAITYQQSVSQPLSITATGFAK